VRFSVSPVTDIFWTLTGNAILLTFSGVIPKPVGQSSSLREMARDGYLFSFIGQSAIAVEKHYVLRILNVVSVALGV